MVFLATEELQGRGTGENALAQLGSGCSGVASLAGPHLSLGLPAPAADSPSRMRRGPKVALGPLEPNSACEQQTWLLLG